MWGGGGNDYVPMTTRDGKQQQSYLRGLVSRLFPYALLLTLGIVVGMQYPSYLSVYSRRPSTTPALLPRSLPPPPDSLIPPISSLPKPQEPIPNIVHYVYGLAPGPQPDFPYFAYLSMRSAMMTLKPERVMFHCLTEPHGYWWDRVMNWEGWSDENGLKRGMVEVVPARDVTHIGKENRPVVHYAHKADVIRLEVLLEHGGIYLDIDTFVLRPFADYSLMLHDVVMGMEARQLNFLRLPMSDDEMDPTGLCNAIIIARKGAEFLHRWMDTYDGFVEKHWAEHSVGMPWILARLYPTLITVMSERSFFWPLWTPDHIHAVYETKEYDFEKSGQLAYHAWESKSKKYLAALDPSTIKRIDTSFTRMAKRFREPDEERRWKAWGKLDGAGSGAWLDREDEEAEREETGEAIRLGRRGKGVWGI
ncbi:hypothetical protein EHS25_005934 [Saitozyma podzolica]|uniref:Uncharacterized protein n=1 Tax=Saitozyma podzolica TaxID=1890683 RepID=A0A427XTQ3_9TREE|nr:hypothetical protein EHS25_005934 [Saitozyma podzolica]